MGIDNVVEDCDFWRTGDTAIAVLGSVPLGDARTGSGAMWPVGNRISGNWIEEVGVHMKQTSCVFRSLAERTFIRGNVCYNGPRAGINYNDDFKGGDVVESNVIFNMVRETGDHGTFKFRDGVMRNMTGNLMIQSGPAFQVTGFDTNFWVDNTVVDTRVNKICAPDTTAALSGTTYAVLKAAPSPPTPSPYPGWQPTYCQSCEHNEKLKDMGKEYGSLVDCMSACNYEDGCA